MLQIKSNIHLIVLISCLFFINCNQTSNTAEKKNVDTSSATTATSDVTTMPVYDPAIDLSVTGKELTKMLYDTLGIRMFEATLKPGDSLPFHSDPDHAFYVLETSKTLFYIAGQNKADTLSGPLWAPGLAFVNGPFTEAFKNIGKTSLRWLKIDIHRPRGIEMPAKQEYDSTIDAYLLDEKSIQKIADTLGIKMFTQTIKQGETVILRSHPDHSVYVLEGGKLAITHQDGQRQVMNMEKGTAFMNGPLSYTAKNTGTTTIKLLLTHIYRPRK